MYHLILCNHYQGFGSQPINIFPFCAHPPAFSRLKPTSLTTAWNQFTSQRRIWTGTTACRRAPVTTTWTLTIFLLTDDRVPSLCRSRLSLRIPQASLCMTPSSMSNKISLTCHQGVRPVVRQLGAQNRPQCYRWRVDRVDCNLTILGSTKMLAMLFPQNKRLMFYIIQEWVCGFNFTVFHKSTTNRRHTDIPDFRRAVPVFS